MADRVPAEAFTPGEFLREELEERGWTQEEFAAIIGRPTTLVNQIVLGKRAITPEAAAEIGAALGVDAQYWLNLESAYRLWLVRQKQGSPALQRISRMAKLQLEMGGKNPLVVLDDADMPTAVNAAVQGAFFSTGQRCTASSRLIVTEKIHDRFLAAMLEKLKTLRVDHALTPGTDIGPVVERVQLQTDLDYIETGKKEGAVLAFGGDQLKRDTEGYFLAPALFADATNSMRIAREEIFGPVACVIRAKDYDEALAVANDTEFGLSAGIVTSSLKHASHFKRHSQAGMVMVNLATAGVDYHVPFGGRKGSSYGPREQGAYAVEFYTVVKTAYVAP